MKLETDYDFVAVTGATASGKTAFAASLAAEVEGEVISADSRQVYRGMDIGTGKDLDDYIVEGRRVPVHLVDIVDAGQKFNVFEYQEAFLDVYKDLTKRNIFPVVCGGSGMYLDSILRGYKLIRVPPNPDLRSHLDNKTLDELTQILSQYKTLHNTTDVDTRKRAIRAIEIEEYYTNQTEETTSFPILKALVTGVKFNRETRRKRITERLSKRLGSGMIEEVESLLKSGLTHDDLIYYGLEYKYITLYIKGNLTYDEMFRALETAIHRFAKRQMTWFRGMERKGIKIHWLDGHATREENLRRVLTLVQK